MQIYTKLEDVGSSGRAWFADWREPDEFLRQHVIVSLTIKDVDHRMGGNKWFREAKILGLFATAIGAGKVRWNAKDPPDGEILLADHIRPVEIVEAFESGRRPDFEFKTGNRKRLWKFSDIPDAIGRAIEKKEAHTNYQRGTILVVYLNIGNDYRSPPSNVLQVIRAACDVSSSTLDATCILWRNWLFGPPHLVQQGQVCIDWRLFED